MNQSDDLDETLEETFPASDAPANTPETGIRIDADHEIGAGEPINEADPRRPPAPPTRE
jgi:hypothetical protein